MISKLPTTPVDKRPLIRRRIVVLRRTIVRISRKIVVINKKIEKITTVRVFKIVKAPKSFVVVAGNVRKTCRKHKQTAVKTCANAKKCDSEEGVTADGKTLKGAECIAEWKPKCEDAKKRVKKCLRIVRVITKPWTPRPDEDLTIPVIPDIKPFPVTPEITKVVKIFTEKKTILEKKIVKITHSIKVLEDKLPTIPEDKKPVYINQITYLKKVRETIIRKVVNITRVIISVSYPRRPRPVPRPITVEEKKVIVDYKKEITVISKRVVIKRKELTILRKKYPTASDDEKPNIRKEVTRIIKIIREENKKIVNIQREILKIIVKPSRPGPIRPGPIRPVPTQITTVLKKTVVVEIKKLRVFQKRIVILRRELISAPVDRRPVIIKEIKEIKVKITKITKKIVNIRRIIRRVYAPTPIRVPIKPTPAIVELVKQITKKVTIYKTKITEITKKITDLEIKLPTLPVDEKPKIIKKIVILRKIVLKFQSKIVHSEQTIINVTTKPVRPVRPIRPVRPVRRCRWVKKADGKKVKICRRPHPVRPVRRCRWVKVDGKRVKICRRPRPYVIPAPATIKVVRETIKDIQKSCSVNNKTWKTCEKSVETCQKDTLSHPEKFTPGQCTKIADQCKSDEENYKRCLKTIKDLTKPTESDTPADCKPDEPIHILPVPINPTVTKIVVKFRKTVTKINVEIKKIREIIVKLEGQLPTLPVDQRPLIRRKIIVLRRVEKTYIRRVNIITHAINVVSFPAPRPRPTPVQREIIREIRKTVIKHIVKITELKKKLVILIQKEKDAPEPEKPVIRKQIVVIRKELIKVIKTVRKVRTVIVNIQHPKPAPRPHPRPLTKEEKVIVKIFRKDIKKIFKKIVKIRREIVVIQKKPEKTPEDDKKIVELTKVVKKLTVEIKHIKKSITRIVFSKPAFNKPGPVITKDEHTTINVFKKKVNILIKKVTIIKKKIVVLQKKHDKAPVDKKPEIKKKIVVLEKEVKKIVKTIVHIKKTIVRIGKPVPKPITKKDIERIIKRAVTIKKDIIILKKKETTIINEVKKIKKDVVVLRPRRVRIVRKIKIITKRITDLKKLTKLLIKPRLTCAKKPEDVKAFNEKWDECKKLHDAKDSTKLEVCIQEITVLAANDFSCIHPKPVQDKIKEYRVIIKKSITKIVKLVTELKVHEVTIKKLIIKRKEAPVSEKPAITIKITEVKKIIKEIVKKITIEKKIVKVHIKHIEVINKTVTKDIKPVFTCLKTPEEEATIGKCSVEITTCETQCGEIHNKWNDFKKQSKDLEATCTANPADTAAQEKLNAVQSKCDLLFGQENDCHTKCSTISKNCNRLQTPSKICLAPKPVQEKIRKYREAVTKLTVTVNKLVTKRVIIKRTIRRIRRLIVRQPEKKDELIKKIEKYTVTLKTLNVKIVQIRKSIREVTIKIHDIKKIKIPVFTPEEKTKITEIKKVIITKRVFIKKIVKKIRVLRVQLVKFTKEVKTVTEETKKTEIITKITEIKKKISVFVKKIEVIRKFIKEQKEVIRVIKRKRYSLLKPTFTCQHTAEDKESIKKLIDEARKLKKTCSEIKEEDAREECFKPWALIQEQLNSFRRPNFICIKPAPVKEEFIKVRKVVVTNVLKITTLVQKITQIRVQIIKFKKDIITNPEKADEIKPKIIELKKQITIIKKKIVEIRKVIKIDVRKCDVIAQPPIGVIITKPLPKKVVLFTKIIKVDKKDVTILKKKEVIVRRKIEKLVNQIHVRQVRINKIHKRLIKAIKIVKISKIIKHQTSPSTGTVHWSHKMFRCTVWKQPEIVGPLPGTGPSKAINLEVLIAKEKAYLQVLKKQTAALEATIASHKNMLEAENSK